MPSHASGVSRHVRTEDLLPPPPIGRAVMLGALAAIAGAVVWALLRIYANTEHGLLAWGIGALIGFAIVKGGGHGTVLAACAGGLALCSIGAGKYVSYQDAVDQYVAESMTEDAYRERQRDATDWVALGDSPTEAQVKEFMDSHDFDPEDPGEFAADVGPHLSSFAAEKPSLDQWRASGREMVTDGYTFLVHLREDFHPLDILFAILGIATAFGIVQKATTQMLVAARQRLRAEREAEAEAAAAEGAE